MIKSLLIANRGEIACRIIRTANKLGIRTIAVFSDADDNALHTRLADEAVHIGPSPAADSYLMGDKLMKAAKQVGADAIHPGYGFLSENADFAEAVIKAGLIWVGPHPDSIRAMGLKDAAKKRMDEAGVPTTPGYLGEDQSPNTLASEAEKIGYPVLIKAVAGGGGKGMRKVEAADEFQDALASCKREAKASFGDDRVLLEKWIVNPRHIEVQVFGDSHGNIIHLFERDCTLQRRHQKVIEEAPAPGMNEQTRNAVCAAAVKAAKAVGYVGAGTIEFIADGSKGLDADKIWFMEMNTRLQVEHPVTEMITGQDLVEWQLRIASGDPLPKAQHELSINGWAMEARLYAENTATGFLPSTGQLDILNLPDGCARIETGVTTHDTVSAFYDPMIAKLVTHGSTREDARRKLAKTCNAVATWPVHNNAGFLSRLLTHEAFAKFDVTTSFIDDHKEALTLPQPPSSSALSLAANFLREQTAHQMPGPWASLSGFRNGASADREARLLVDGSVIETQLIDQQPTSDAHIFTDKTGAILVERGTPYRISTARHDASGGSGPADGIITAPMPGRIVSVDIANGDDVKEGQTLIKLEAMKMEHALIAPFEGTVSDLGVNEGDQVPEGHTLMIISSDNEK